MSFYTYVITNEAHQIYIGHTDDIQKRIDRHNGKLPNKHSSYRNKNRHGLWILMHTEEFETRSQAIKREKQLKSSRRRQWIKDTYMSSCS